MCLRGVECLSPEFSNPEELSDRRVKTEAIRSINMLDLPASTPNGSHTFRERLPTDFYLRREARAPWAKSIKLGSSPERTLLALVAPGRPHGAAAGVHAVPPGDLRRALLVLVPLVAALQADVCWAI